MELTFEEIDRRINDMLEEKPNQLTKEEENQLLEDITELEILERE